MQINKSTPLLEHHPFIYLYYILSFTGGTCSCLMAHVGVNYPFKCPASSSRKFLQRESAQPGVCRAAWRQCSGALRPACPKDRPHAPLLHRLPPTFYAEVRSSNCVEFAPSGLCLSEAETVRAEFWGDGGGEREKLSSRTDASSDGEWIKTKCLLQSGGEAVTRRQMSPTAHDLSLLKPFPPRL